jgi:hypothetical protein
MYVSETETRESKKYILITCWHSPYKNHRFPFCKKEETSPLSGQVRASLIHRKNRRKA